MPSEPDNQMDDLLKTYAKKRRDEAGAPLEMHAATRRLLQAEVAKLRPVNAPTSASWLEALKIFWPRLAFAAAILFVAGLAALTFLQSTNDRQAVLSYAKQDAAPPASDDYLSEQKAAESRFSLAPSPAKPESEAVVTLQDQISTLTPARRELKPLPELATATEAEAVDVAKKLKSVDTAKNEPRDLMELSRAANTVPAAPPALVSEPVALGAVVAPEADKLGRAAGGPPTSTKLSVEEKVQAVAGVKQLDDVALRFKAEQPLAQQQPYNATARSRFANVQSLGRQNLSKATTAYDSTVLANFVVEQDGEQLRVVDADGSVYDGRVLFGEPTAAGVETQLKEAAEMRRDAAKPALAQAGKDQRAQQPLNGPVAAASWNFRVSGTNRTLQQPVIVDGILYETDATNALGQTDVKATADSLRFYRTAPGQVPAQQKGYGGAVSSPQTPAQNSTANSAVNSLNQPYNGQSMNLLNTRRIQGNVRVGATNQLPLDAVPDGNQR